MMQGSVLTIYWRLGARMDAKTKTLMQIAGVTVQSCPGPRLLRDVVPGVVEELRDRATGKRKPVPLRLVLNGEAQPWTDAEAALGGGLWPGLYVLVGATGTGKTQLCMSLALGAAMGGSPVAYIGLELDDPGVVSRLLGLLASRPWSALYLGAAKDRMETPTPAIDEPAVQEAAQRLSDLPFQLVEGDPMGFAPEWLAEVAQQLVSIAAERGIDTQLHPPLIVLDFLQLVGDPMPSADTHSPRSLDMRQRIQQASYRAREIARRHGVAVLAVSSTARESAKALRIENNKTLPYPGELVGTGKESGEIEYSADGVMVLVEHGGEGRDKLVYVALAKVRAGQPGWLRLWFDGAKHRPATEAEFERVVPRERSQETSVPRTKNKGGLSSEYLEQLASGKKP
jgi:KaiC/GvpD/RAD55 family RecA-like ATPase